MGIISVFGKEYLGGHSLEEGIHNCETLYLKGIAHYKRPICSTLDILGEEAKSENAIRSNLDAYLQAIEQLGVLTNNYIEWSKEYGIRVPFTVSVKPSSLCLFDRKYGEVEFDSKAPLLPNLRRLAEASFTHNIPITIDMEDHEWTYPTLKLIYTFLSEGLPIDSVLQSCLDQTIDDINLFLKHDFPIDKSKITIRACRGIYQEPKTFATRSPSEAKKRLFHLVDKLFTEGYYIGIATHDPKLQQKIKKEIIEKRNISKDRYEYQGLKGVYSFEDVILPKALTNGENVRLYLPVELNPGDGKAYMRRRILMNPEIDKNFLCDRMKRHLRQKGPENEFKLYN